MPTFSTWFRDQNKLIAEALTGLHYDPEITFRYIVGDSTERVKPYLLPIQSFEGTGLGLFKIGDKLNEVPLGFRIRREFWETEYFKLTPSGISKTESPGTDTMYIPLELTSFAGKVGDEGPFLRYGVGGASGDHPLYLVEETDKGLILRGFYQDKKKELDFCTRTNDKADKVRIFLKNYYSSLALIEEGSNPEPKTNALEEKVSMQGSSISEINWHDPKSIVAYLDKTVIGQTRAKKASAVTFSNYMINMENKDSNLPKDCMILIGPTGSGKTMIMKTLSQAAGIPYAKASLSGKASEGYVGHRLSDVFKQISEVTDDESPYAVVFLDEVDKVAINSESLGNDYGPKLQQEMIGWLEGDKILLKTKKEGNRDEKWLDTSNILFVMAGAFHGPDEAQSLEKIISKRIGVESRIGFTRSKSKPEEEDLLSYVLPEDLINFGLKPELVGRISARATLSELSIADKVRILRESESSILKKYENLMQIKGYGMIYDNSVLSVIAGQCPERTGARDLNAVCSNLFMEIIYDPSKFAEDKKITLTPDLVMNLLSANPVIEVQEAVVSVSSELGQDCESAL
ncbi:AAA domain-containing protein [archaeon]|jgi:ATP-dependent Clp protease ATP-binding subunit ClpX|nr:AAA domain-containing protein [archaeon]MBT6761568.1 AAA domain-containing protein [archaeon]